MDSLKPYAHGPAMRWYMSLDVDQIEAAYRVIEAAKAHREAWLLETRLTEDMHLLDLFEAIEALEAAEKGE